MTILLTQLVLTGLGGKKRERGREGKKKRILEREREFTFSLDFSAIGSSNPNETRGKVDPPRKGLRVGTSIMEFRQTLGGKGFLLLDLFFG